MTRRSGRCRWDCGGRAAVTVTGTTTGWRVALRAGATLAAAVGVGRFVFTPILPLMQSQAGVSAQLGATLATGNHVGYLAGALAAMIAPRLARTAFAVRVSAVAVVLSLAAMPLVAAPKAWIVLRGIAGAGSAIMFVAAASAVLITVPTGSRHLVGWAYGGVGAGIAASGAVVLLVDLVGDWHTAWWAAAGLAALLGASGWRLAGTDPASEAETVVREPISRPHRWFVPLVVAYFLEGVGYIIAGTFLVATVAASVPGELGKATWIVVGLAAIPSCVLWAWLTSRLGHPTLLATALGLQATGIVLAGLAVGVVDAVVAAVLFGGTFMGVTAIALDAGNHLQIPAAVAILSAVYAVGQAAGPVAVAPLLSGGFHGALFVAAGVVALAALTALMLRIRFPHARPTVAIAPLASAASDR
ncbi:YbfB/YjiJ family MFS transporter [Micromonospora sp. NPDC048999]|uniref:YbfB/YjiJ family MFS transporter n=1 Tax=Micromonospora sp. NPDC048999 TaxID=3155391 RepID=UPI0033E5AE68